MTISAPGHLSADAKPNAVYRYFDHLGRLVFVGIAIRHGRHHGQVDPQRPEWLQYAERYDIEVCRDRDAAFRCKREMVEEFRPPFNKVYNANWQEIRSAYLSLRAAEDLLASIQAGGPEPAPSEDAAPQCRSSPRIAAPETASTPESFESMLANLFKGGRS